MRSVALGVVLLAVSREVQSQSQSGSRPDAQAQKQRSVQADTRRLEAEARSILAELVAINTTASSGSTTPAATKLAARFRAAGFPAADVMVIGEGPRSRNLVVRWRGRTRAKPVVINAHLDVVDAPRIDWATDPFQLTEQDGYLYGRGVVDNKGSSAAAVAAMIALRRAGVVPERDIVLALTAGEETDIENGVRWLLANRRDLVDAEYVLNLDAGGADMQGGSAAAFGVQAAEKMYLDLELVARGPGGHSSMPNGATPIDRLARALERLSRYTFPVRVSPVLRTYFERRAPLRTDILGRAMAAVAVEPDDLAALNVVLREPLFSVLLRTTCIATMLRAGTAANAIPQEATATVNCRLLPGDTQERVVAALQTFIADTSITFRVLAPAVPSEASIPDTAFYRMIQRVVAADHGYVPAIPYMETGATDALWFRNAGIPTFGVAGYFLPGEDHERVHGRDERMSIEAFRHLVRYTERLVREVAKP